MPAPRHSGPGATVCGPATQSCKVSSLCNGDNADGGHGDFENDVDHNVDGQRVPHSRKVRALFPKFVQISFVFEVLEIEPRVHKNGE